MQAIAEIVLRLAGQGGSAAGLLPLLQLASSVGEAAPRAQLQAAVLDALLPDGPAHQTAERVLQRLAAVLPQCSEQQVRQLRDAVQAALTACTAAPDTKSGRAATASEAVRLCFRRLHAAACSCGAAPQPAEAAVAAEGQGSTQKPDTALKAAAVCLFILGPFSSADVPTCLAETGLLLSSLLGAASEGNSPEGSACSSESLCWLLQALAAAFRQLPADERPAAGQEDMCPSSQRYPAALALMQEAPAALHALLLSAAGGCPAVRSAAIEATLAAPPAAQAPLRLLRSLVDACGSDSMAGGSERLLAAPSGAQPQQMQAEGTDAEVGGSNAIAAQALGSQAQRQALLSLLELLGAMSAGYEQQRAAFQRRLAAEAGQQSGADNLQQGQQGTSKAGRPLRPASEWWVGDGQGPAGTDSNEDQQAGLANPSSGHGRAAKGAAPAEAAAGGPGGSPFDYMRGEDQAAKQEAAAQRFLDSLLAAADTTPACFLPLLERLAGGRCPEEEGSGAAMPADVQVGEGGGGLVVQALQTDAQPAKVPGWGPLLREGGGLRCWPASRRAGGRGWQYRWAGSAEGLAVQRGWLCTPCRQMRSQQRHLRTPLQVCAVRMACVAARISFAMLPPPHGRPLPCAPSAGWLCCQSPSAAAQCILPSAAWVHSTQLVGTIAAACAAPPGWRCSKRQ